jgi:group I intron endonuclease
VIVYKATNKLNGKIYIGKTIRTLSHAKARHHQRAKFIWKYGTYSRFYTAIRKYGFDAFEWEEIYRGISDEDIQIAERRFIALMSAENKHYGYNMTPGGDGGAGKLLSEEHKEKLRAAFSGSGNPMAGKHGSAHPAFGYKKTEEQKAHLSEFHKGRPKSDRQKGLLSAARKRLSRFSDADYQIMKSYYEEGHGLYFIGEQFECQASVVWKILSREFPGLERRKKSSVSPRKKAEFAKKRDSGVYKGERAGPSKVTDADRRAICDRRAKGESYASISATYPVGLTGVRAIIKDWGPSNGFPFLKIVAKRETT